jgi:hypothetical protein
MVISRFPAVLVAQVLRILPSRVNFEVANPKLTLLVPMCVEAIAGSHVDSIEPAVVVEALGDDALALLREMLAPHHNLRSIGQSQRELFPAHFEAPWFRANNPRPVFLKRL